MRKATVPVDMTSEQKEILGIISKRQLIYLVVGGFIIYSYIPFVYNLFPLGGLQGFFIRIIICIMSATPIAFVVIFLGFQKKEQFHMSYDKYFITNFQRKKQYGNWRKGK